MKDLGDHLGVSSAAASQMLERLVQQHLILRSEDPSDRRVKHLVLTERGIQTIQESIRSREEWMDDLSKTLSADEKAQVVAALNILIEKTQQLERSCRFGDLAFSCKETCLYVTTFTILKTIYLY